MEPTRPARSSQLRAQQRRIVAWSMAAAVVVHVAAFLLWPAFQIEAGEGWSAPRLEDAGDLSTPVRVDVVFGPPEIRLPSGEFVTEQRRLEVDHVLASPVECRGISPEEKGLFPRHGRLRLRVDASGHAEVVEAVTSSGSTCADAVLVAVGDALHYEWLPGRRYSAPLEVIQPIALVRPTG